MKRYTRNTDFWTVNTPNKVGPGSYNLAQSKKPRSSSVPFSKAEIKPVGEKVVSSQLPGPGSYSLSEDWIKSHSPSSSFVSKLPRTGPIPIGSSFQSPVMDTPGPGAYYLSSGLVTKPKRRFRQLSMIVEASVSSIPYRPGEDLVLGPTSYNPDNTLIKPKIYSTNFANKMQKREVFESKPSVSPGPGKYNVVPEKDFEKPNWVFASKVNKSTDKKNDQIPGPGAYNPKPYIRQPRVLVEGFGSTTERGVCASNDPYHVQNSSLNLPKLEAPLYDPAKADYYREKYLNPKTPIPKPAFGTSEKREPAWASVDVRVGPGDYKQISSSQNHSKFISKSPRFKPGKEDPIPGPGSYENVKPTVHAVSLAKAPRFSEKKGEVPESYLSHEEWKPKQNRAKDAQYYEPNLRFESSSPRFSTVGSESPGPGHYEIRKMKKQSQVVKSTENRFSQHGSYIKAGITGEEVGPGSYHKEMNLGKKTFNISPEIGDDKPWI